MILKTQSWIQLKNEATHTQRDCKCWLLIIYRSEIRDKMEKDEYKLMQKSMAILDNLNKKGKVVEKRRDNNLSTLYFENKIKFKK